MATACKDFKSSFLSPFCIMSPIYTDFFQSSMTPWRCAEAAPRCRHPTSLKIVLIVEKEGPSHLHLGLTFVSDALRRFMTSPSRA